MMLIFKKITDCFPEQWEIFKGAKQVGYIRIRSGILTCYYPDCNGVKVYSHQFDDDLKGCFDNDEECTCELCQDDEACIKRVSEMNKKIKYV